MNSAKLFLVVFLAVTAANVLTLALLQLWATHQSERLLSDLQAITAQRQAGQQEAARHAAEQAHRERAEQAATAKRAQAEAEQQAQQTTGAQLDGATRAGIANRWVPAIQRRVRQFWVRPQGVEDGVAALVSIRLNPGGHVVPGSVRILEGSGQAAFDQSVISAVYNASPLPVPDGSAFDLFRDFDFRFRP